MCALTVTARAKVNLFLTVGECLPSGYHQVRTVLQSISLADELNISPASDIVFLCDDKSLADETNLVVRAARLLRERYGVGDGAALSLSKRIPAGAGLGGGSADAAAALMALSHFWGLRTSLDELREIGAELGADIPFCLAGGTAMATGFGEEIISLSDLELGEFLIVKPHRSLETARVYREWDELSLGRPAASADRLDFMLKAIDSNDRDAVIKNLENDLDGAAERLLPEIRWAKETALHFGAEAAMVTGSGSAIMVFPSKTNDARRLAAAFSGEPVETFVVHTVGDGVVINDAH